MKKAPAKMKKTAMKMAKKSPAKKMINTDDLSGGKKRLVEGVAGAAAKMKKASMAKMGHKKK